MTALTSSLVQLKYWFSMFMFTEHLIILVMTHRIYILSILDISTRYGPLFILKITLYFIYQTTNVYNLNFGKYTCREREIQKNTLISKKKCWFSILVG